MLPAVVSEYKRMMVGGALQARVWSVVFSFLKKVGGMEQFVQFEQRDRCLYCRVERFEYSSPNVLALLQQILQGYRQGEAELIFVDFTVVKEHIPATLKSLTGILAEEVLWDLFQELGKIPRVAVLGSSPHIIASYKPAEDILRKAGMPVAIFTDEQAAKQWLFSP